MSHSLRAKLRCLRYKGILEDKDYKWLCHALDLEKAEQEQTDKSNLEKICEELAAENDDLRDQLAIRDRFEQEPDDDVVSRKAVKEILAKYYLGESRIAEELNELPSVQRTSNENKKHVENTCDDAISHEDIELRESEDKE